MSVEGLNIAARHNEEEEVLRLIDEEDVDVNERNDVSFFLFLFLDALGLVEQDGYTAFLQASLKGNLNMMQLLLEKGANPLLKDDVSSFLSFFSFFLLLQVV